jgi:hypothetical protein
MSLPLPPRYRAAFRNRASSLGLALLLAAPLGLLTTACTSTSPVPKAAATTPASTAAPAITTQPADQGIAVGGTATFSVVATGTAPLSYQWQLGATHVGGDAASYSGGSNLAAGSYPVTVTVTNNAGSVTSTSATLTVTSTSTAVAPGITTQPAAQGIAVGGTATFSVVATGTAPLSYQWHLSGADVGSDAASCTLGSDLAAGSYPVTVTVTNSAGTVTSDSATLTVTGTPAVSLGAQSGTLASAVPGSAVFAATTANLADATVGSVTWYTSAAGTTVGSAPAGVAATVGDVVSNAATVTLAADASTVAGTYYFTATFGAATSAVATLSVPEVIVYPNDEAIDVTPTDARVPAGRTLTVDATALTSTHTLKWNGTAETDGTFYIKAGATTATLAGGAGADTFDFTTSGVTFSSGDQVNGGGGSDTLKLGAVSGTDALAHVMNVETITFANDGAVAIVSPSALVTSGQTLTVDASALTDSFTWDGSANTGTFNITSGSGGATITGGSGDDTITDGGGTNLICGGPGSDTIVLDGAGRNTVVFNSLSGVDTISNFHPGSDALKLMANADGGNFVTTAGTLVSSGTTGTYRFTAGPIDGNAGSPSVLVVLNNTIASDAALAVSLASGGTNQLTLANGVANGSDLLVLYRDGAQDAHLVVVRLYGGGAATTFTSGDLTVIDLAILKNVDKPEIWGALNLSIG